MKTTTALVANRLDFCNYVLYNIANNDIKNATSLALSAGFCQKLLSLGFTKYN